MRRKISFGRAALICALFLCVESILVSVALPGTSTISANVISSGFYEPTELQGDPQRYWIKINIPAFTLTLFSGKAPVKTYPIAVGKPASPSRIGTCEVVGKAKYPTWYPPDGRPAVPPGPDNPISCRWLGLSWSGYGIHGTNNPKSIGKAVTLGCIRMHDKDVMELFDVVPIGTKVEFVYETVEVSSHAQEPMGMRLTVHRDLYCLGTNEIERVLESLRTVFAKVMSCTEFDTMPDVDRKALATLISAGAGKPEPIPWQVRVELGAMAGSSHSSRGTGHVPDTSGVTSCHLDVACGNAVTDSVNHGEGVAFACSIHLGEDDSYDAIVYSYRADFHIDPTACENATHTDCLEVPDSVCVEMDLALIEGDRVLVALRPVAEAFGYNVGWDGQWQAAIVNQNLAQGMVREGRFYVTLDELRRLLDEVVVTWDPQTLILRISPI